MNGNISLFNADTPPELKRLWESADSDARHFRNNIRFFNGQFSFTSLYCHLDNVTTNMSKNGIYTFRAHGQMYHNVRSFGGSGLEPKHLELYFYDDDPNLEHRYNKCRQDHFEQDKAVMGTLVDILKDNPYSQHLRSMGQAENLDDYCISVNLDPRLDQKTYNVPIASEVAAVWIEGRERLRNFDYNVLLTGKDNQVYGIRPYHGCYDALSYPLFFPRGELRWHRDIPKVGVSMDVVRTARESHGARNRDPDPGESSI